MHQPPPMPADNEALQLSWSRCRSKAIEDGAHQRVRKACRKIREHGLPLENVLVIGPQHGYELQAFQAHGCQSVIGVDICDEFIADGEALGFPMFKTPMESMADVVPGEGMWNIYTCHSLEHAYDIDSAIRSIMTVLDLWAWVDCPFELNGTRDRAHLSSFKTADDIAAKFLPLRVLYRNDSHSKAHEGEGKVELLLQRTDL